VVTKAVLSIFVLPKHAAEYVLMRSNAAGIQAKKPRTPRRASTTGSGDWSLSFTSYIFIALSTIFASLFLFIVLRDYSTAVIPVTSSLVENKSAPSFEFPKNIPTREELLELRDQISLEGVKQTDTENTLKSIKNGVSFLEEQMEETARKLARLEATIPKIDPKQIEGLQKDLSELLKAVEQLDESHNVPLSLLLFIQHSIFRVSRVTLHRS
jgi:septal ring factor EnvC (AmiA/AmiB activator)